MVHSLCSTNFSNVWCKAGSTDLCLWHFYNFCKNICTEQDYYLNYNNLVSHPKEVSLLNELPNACHHNVVVPARPSSNTNPAAANTAIRNQLVLQMQVPE